ncbi:MerR family DNA-binding protein [Acidimangrovimonas sediminis]|uniref:MerR family DNA-binding protein n=1 Tax=Acidimangrovimonas sediminis TaxID=2056283 RepID=UPI000C800225|nr:MerR family DNA-binding protein [Acidimangrovimonas sediminis]
MDGGPSHAAREPLRFRDACRRYGVTKRTLIHYEALGILSPRREGRDRVYDRRQQVRLELVLRGRRFRLPLETLRQLLELYDAEGRDAQQRRWREVLAEQARTLEAEERHLARLRSEIGTILEAEGRIHG